MIDPMTTSVLSVNPSPHARRGGRLLDAAARLFARFGFDKTSVDEIARAAGVSKGAVYLHWPSKDTLFEATLIREGPRLQDDIRDRIEADPAGGTTWSPSTTGRPHPRPDTPHRRGSLRGEPPTPPTDR